MVSFNSSPCGFISTFGCAAYIYGGLRRLPIETILVRTPDNTRKGLIRIGPDKICPESTQTPTFLEKLSGYGIQTDLVQMPFKLKNFGLPGGPGSGTPSRVFVRKSIQPEIKIMISVRTYIYISTFCGF